MTHFVRPTAQNSKDIQLITKENEEKDKFKKVEMIFFGHICFKNYS